MDNFENLVNIPSSIFAKLSIKTPSLGSTSKNTQNINIKIPLQYIPSSVTVKPTIVTKSYVQKALQSVQNINKDNTRLKTINILLNK